MRTSFERCVRAAVALSIMIFPLAAISFSGSRENHARQAGPQECSSRNPTQNLPRRRQMPPAATWARKSARSAMRRLRASTHERIWAVQCPKSPPRCSRKFPTPPPSSTTDSIATSTSHVEDGKLFQSEYEKRFGWQRGVPGNAPNRLDHRVGRERLRRAAKARRFHFRSSAFLLFKNANLGAFARIRVWRLRLQPPDSSRLHRVPQRTAAERS